MIKIIGLKLMSICWTVGVTIIKSFRNSKSDSWMTDQLCIALPNKMPSVFWLVLAPWLDSIVTFFCRFTIYLLVSPIWIHYDATDDETRISFQRISLDAWTWDWWMKSLRQRGNPNEYSNHETNEDMGKCPSPNLPLWWKMKKHWAREANEADRDNPFGDG